eukprot:NODE_299_length_2468_cov_24.930799_g277_i0.p1 GENE.NODE_299_length_2468_cov_24.930799_g277_i0~~NODE_299_length_2468_cov_24.930799_g277_i0.p1  ORF type:complete len:803 (+),score=225.08 NODE_299_length_2468_cov_24.930799_g277_i0:67-2409(+)
MPPVHKWQTAVQSVRSRPAFSPTAPYKLHPSDRSVDSDFNPTGLTEAQLKEIWRRFDLEDKGYISIQQLGMTLHECQQNVTSEEVEDLLHTMDPSASGVLTWNDFAAFLSGKPTDGHQIITAARHLLRTEGAQTEEQLKKHRLLKTFNLVDRFFFPLLFFVAIYNLFVVSYRMCFHAHPHPSLQVFDLVLDTLLVLHVALKCLRPTEINGHHFFSKREILRRYLLSPEFFLDVVYLLPLDTCGMFVHGFDTPVYFRANKLLVAIVLPQTWQHCSRSLTNPLWAHILKAWVAWVATVHFVACAFFLVALQEGSENTYEMLFEAEFLSSPALFQYLQSLDWAVKTMSGLSRGASIPATDLQHVLALGTILIGVNVYALIIATISNALAADSVLQRWRRKMDEVKSYMHYKALPPTFQHEVLHYYRYVFRQSGSVLSGESDPLQDLPVELKSRIDFEIGANIMQKVPLFRQLAQDNDLFVPAMISKLRLATYVPGYAVSRAGRPATEMYFVTQGELLVKDAMGRETDVLGSGAFFGELALVHSLPHQETVETKTYCNLLRLAATDFIDVTAKFPGFQAQLKQAADDHIRRLITLQQEQDHESDYDTSSTSADSVESWLSRTRNLSENSFNDRRASTASSFTGAALSSNSHVGYSPRSLTHTLRRQASSMRLLRHMHSLRHPRSPTAASAPSTPTDHYTYPEVEAESDHDTCSERSPADITLPSHSGHTIGCDVLLPNLPVLPLPGLQSPRQSPRSCRFARTNHSVESVQVDDTLSRILEELAQ